MDHVAKLQSAADEG